MWHAARNRTCVLIDEVRALPLLLRLVALAGLIAIVVTLGVAGDSSNEVGRAAQGARAPAAHPHAQLPITPAPAQGAQPSREASTRSRDAALAAQRHAEHRRERSARARARAAARQRARARRRARERRARAHRLVVPATRPAAPARTPAAPAPARPAPQSPPPARSDEFGFEN